jgi:glycerol uptake facilitator-like aquaporin
LFLLKNAICITVKVKDILSLVKRSALLYTINLILLALGERINPMASIFSVKLSVSASMYKWLGSVVITKGLVYITAALSSQYINIHNTSEIAKLVISYLCFFTLLRANACEGCRY